MHVKQEATEPISISNKSSTGATKSPGRRIATLHKKVLRRILELAFPDLIAAARDTPRVIEVEIVRCPCEDHLLEGPCISAGVFLRDQHRPISKLLSISRETRAMVTAVFPDVFPIGHDRYEHGSTRHCKRGLVRFDRRRDIILVHENSEIRGDPPVSFTANRHVREFSWSGPKNMALCLRGGSPRTVSATMPEWSRRLLFEIQHAFPGLEKLYLAWDMGLPDWSRCSFQRHYTLSRPGNTPWVPTDPVIQYWWSPLSRIQKHPTEDRGVSLTPRQLEDFQTDKMLEGCRVPRGVSCARPVSRWM